jgi:hypothetical protein
MVKVLQGTNGQVTKHYRSRYMSNTGYMLVHKWVLEAKAKAYPLCPVCQEPLPKDRWKKGIHISCFLLEYELRERIETDKANYRQVYDDWSE